MELAIIDLNKIKAEIQKPLGNGWYWKIFKLDGEWWGAKYQPG